MVLAVPSHEPSMGIGPYFTLKWKSCVFSTQYSLPGDWDPDRLALLPLTRSAYSLQLPKLLLRSVAGFDHSCV